jgi:division protein CdvB (Snf7/Vps24/ESCRT-III family)
MFSDKPTLTNRLREAIKPTPMKRRIQITTHKIRVQMERLDRTVSQMEARDKTLYDRCVKSLATRDTESATIFANECVQIRKLVKTSLSSQICLEQALLRLETIEEFGDTVHSMGAVKGILGTVREELEGKLPQISTGLGDIEDSLANLTQEIGEAVESETTTIPTSDDSARILKEADLTAEQKIKEKFPEIPQIYNDPARLR